MRSLATRWLARWREWRGFHEHWCAMTSHRVPRRVEEPAHYLYGSIKPARIYNTTSYERIEAWGDTKEAAGLALHAILPPCDELNPAYDVDYQRFRWRKFKLKSVKFFAV